MADPPTVIPLADSRSDRQSKARQRRRVTKAKLAVAKKILALIDRDTQKKE
jgi:hypothetical protein